MSDLWIALLVVPQQNTEYVCHEYTFYVGVGEKINKQENPDFPCEDSQSIMANMGAWLTKASSWQCLYL